MIYDTIIIGAGPAGLSAAIYAARYQLKALVIGKEEGGYAVLAHKVENYPGFGSISGRELISKMLEQVKAFGIEIKNHEVKKIIKNKNGYKVFADKEYESKTIIIAIGTERQKLGLKNEDKLIGKGVSYCATCDAPFFKNKIVGVIGGSNSSVMTALLLCEHAKKVYVVYRKNELRADAMQIEKLKKNKKVEIIYKANVKEIIGKDKLQEIILDNNKKLKIDGLFIEIGSVPNVALTKPLGIRVDEKGYIIVNEKRETSLPGIFAAGDVIVKTLRQIITAASDGAVASKSAFDYLKMKK